MNYFLGGIAFSDNRSP